MTVAAQQSAEQPQEKRTLYYHGREAVLKIEDGDKLSRPVKPPHIYSDRALPIAHDGDVVMLHPEDWRQKDWLLDHYRRVGLKPTSEVIQLTPFDQFPDLDRYELSTFLFCRKTHLAQPDQGRFQMTQAMNDKNTFVSACHALDIAIPTTACFQNKNTIADLSDFRYPLYLKISTSFTGMGVFKANSVAELEAMLALLSPRIRFQLQEDLGRRGIITFLNLQYLLRNGRAERVLLTDQVIDGVEHIGNKYSPADRTYDPAWRVTDPLAKLMVARGLKGLIGIDVAVCLENDQLTFLPVECNPRPNGSSYPTAIAKKLNYNGAWTAKAVATNLRDINRLDLGELEYSPLRETGVIVHIASTLPKGKLGVTFFAPSEGERRRLEDRLLHKIG